MVKILIKKTNKEVITPKYKTDGSSGVDLSAFLEKKVVIKPNSSELIPTGLQVAIPEELEIQIRPRSGLAAKNNVTVLNTPGTIDSDYRGEIKVIIYNTSTNFHFYSSYIFSANSNSTTLSMSSDSSTGIEYKSLTGVLMLLYLLNSSFEIITIPKFNL